MKSVPFTFTGAVGHLIRRWPSVRRFRAEGILKRLPLLGFNSMAWRQIGPMSLGFDVRDQFQREMLLDHYEPMAEAVLQEVLRPGDCYVDIGAQLGFTAAIAAGRIGSSGTMLLFEPDPAALPRLKSHLDRADRATLPNVQLIEAACSDHEGEMLFEQSTTLGHSRILQTESHLRDGKLIRVPLLVPDEVIRKAGIDRIRLLKIDVEGHEASVLAGLQGTLAAGRVDVIMIEKNLWLMALPREDAAILHALIARHGYIGIHEFSCRQIVKDTLLDDTVPLENLYYCREESLLAAFANPPLKKKSDGFSAKELEELADIAIHPEGASARARNIILHVRLGKTAEGIAMGEELLRTFPGLDWFRGHLAHWLKSTGEVDRAAGHYKYLLEKTPDNPEVRDILASISAREKALSQ